MTSFSQTNELIGKHILIGVTYLDEDENVVSQYQTHGKIVEIDPATGISIEKADGAGKFTIPVGSDNLWPAEPGEYRIRSSGEVVIDPDFLSTWNVYLDL